ncbi:hypothetical protein ATANTOWER_027304 [Ataeniobius toweri]|uniref:Uncharacterized protein n=1 Tax=Ataeniobius toweri TaxID=208326 RepID=A0ABU7C9U2_9TELE|nr:hypothetical protein [Ataeniobius toweri]
MTLRSGRFSPYFKFLLSSTFLFAFYGFLRLREFTFPSYSFVSSRDLAFSDIKLYPDHFKLYRKQTKTKVHVSFPLLASMARFVHSKPSSLLLSNVTNQLTLHAPFPHSRRSSHDRLLVPQISEANFSSMQP